MLTSGNLRSCPQQQPFPMCPGKYKLLGRHNCPWRKRLTQRRVVGKTGFRICLCIATPAVCACTWIDQSNARSANPCLCNNMGRGPCLATTWAKAALRRRPLLVGRLHSVSATTHQTHGRAARLVGSCHDAECQYTMPCTCNCCCPNAGHGPKIFGTRPRR